MFNKIAGLVLFFVLGHNAFGKVSASAPVKKKIDGKKLASTYCLACHGPNGVSLSPAFPNLCGQKKAFLIKMMERHVNGGMKVNTMKDSEVKSKILTGQIAYDASMTSMVSHMDTKEKREALAKYYSSQKFCTPESKKMAEKSDELLKSAAKALSESKISYEKIAKKLGVPLSKFVKLKLIEIEKDKKTGKDVVKVL